MSDNPRIYKFRLHTGGVVQDPSYSADFESAPSFKNKISAGQLGIYHKELFRRFFIPYEQISRIYKQVQIIPVDDSPAYEHYRIIIDGPNGRITDIMFGEGFMNRTEDNDLADEFLHLVEGLNAASHVQIGFQDSDLEPKSKKGFWKNK